MESGQYGEAGTNSVAECSNNNDDNKMETQSISQAAGAEIIGEGRGKVQNKAGADVLSNVNNVDTTNTYDVKTVNLYEGPFYAYLESKNKNIGRLHPMAIGRILHEDLLLKNSITEIKSIGRNRIKIEMRNILEINKLVNNPLLKNKDYVVYVPKHLTERRGVIKGVDTMLSETYLVQNIESDRPIIGCRRIFKKILENNESNLVPRETVVVTVKGNKLPQYVFINSVRCLVEPYISSVIQCYNCLRFGHFSSQCKNNNRSCKNCSSSHDGECQESSPNCCHCKSTNHNSLSKNCPVYLKQRKIKEIMATMNVTFKDAQGIVENPTFAHVTSNKFSVLANLNDYGTFPPLPSQGASNNCGTLSTHTESSPNKPLSINIPKSLNSVKKRKVLSPQTSPPQREFDTRHFPSRPLPYNPYRPIKNIEEINVPNIVKNITEYLYKVFEKAKKNNSMPNIEELDIRKNIENMIGLRGLSSNQNNNFNNGS